MMIELFRLKKYCFCSSVVKRLAVCHSVLVLLAMQTHADLSLNKMSLHACIHTNIVLSLYEIFYCYLLHNVKIACFLSF